MRFCALAECTCTTSNCYTATKVGEEIHVRNNDTRKVVIFSVDDFKDQVERANLKLSSDLFAPTVYTRLKKLVSNG